MPSDPRPNILYIMADDHAAHAMSCYGSRINQTPHLDRIAQGGMRFDNCFCTNSICTPSRAVILSGKHSHMNGVLTLRDKMDNRQPTFPKMLQAAGYQTAIYGKWHLGHGELHDPTGFDHWNVLPGHGQYHNTEMIEMGVRKQMTGYVTDLVTDMTLDFLRRRDASRPFMVMCHHKAPHRHWEPDEKHAHMYDDVDIPEPPTLFDDYSNRSNAAKNAKMRINRDMVPEDFKADPPAGLSEEDDLKWKYQRYIKDYLRCIASIDDNVGRLLDYLDETGLAENTIVIYTSDQGFFLGDHGWFDKRFMYEESLRMPFIIRHPRGIKAGMVCKDIITNLDFAPYFLESAGLPVPDDMQGRSFRPLLSGEAPLDWQKAMYYRYWEHMTMHYVPGHYGVRTERYKLIFYYGRSCGANVPAEVVTDPEWELYDLERDPLEMRNVYDDPAYAGVVRELTGELERLKREAKDDK